MSIFDDDFLPYYEKACKEYHGAMLERRGYAVYIDKQIGPITVDLYAKNDKEQLYYEFKIIGAGKQLPRQIQGLSNARAKLREIDPSAKFHIVIVPKLIRNPIEIEGIEGRILDYLMEDITPNALEILSTHTRLKNVDNIEISSIQIDAHGIHITGGFIIEVTLQYGSDGDQERDMGIEKYDSFPCDFSLSLDKDLKITTGEFTFDTSSFYD